MRRMIITGPTGAIGRGLIRLAGQKGMEVLALVHPGSKRASELESLEYCRVLRIDASDYSRAEAQLEREGIKPESDSLFFHLAWEASFGAGREDNEVQDRNVENAVEAVRLAKRLGCSAFIGTGSQAEYGRVTVPLRPDTEPHPETGYGRAKLLAGQKTREMAEELGIRHVWTRVLSVYGPYDRPETLISTAMNRMLRNEETAFSPCDQTWDYIYSEDAARAVFLSGEKGIHGKTYVVGSGIGRPLRWYIEKTAEAAGYSREIGFGKRNYNEKQVMFLQADISELKADTGFAPEVGFEEGIRRYRDWITSRESGMNEW